MKNSAIPAIAFALAFSCVFSMSVEAQELNLFSGRGLGAKYDLKPANADQSRWPSLKDFSLGEPPKLFQFGAKTTEERSFPKLFGGEMPKFELFKGMQSESSMGGMPSLFPKRDPAQPGFLEQLNAKSKGFMDRTANWAQRQNAGFKAKTAETWDSITRGFNFDGRRTPAAPSMQPMRAAETPNMKNGVKRY